MSISNQRSDRRKIIQRINRQLAKFRFFTKSFFVCFVFSFFVFFLMLPPSPTSSVQFSPSTDRVVGGTCWTIQQRFCSSLFCKRPLWAVLTWAGMSTLWCCPSSIFSADDCVALPPRCPEAWFWRGCRGVWHAQTMPVSVSWQLPEEVPVDPQGSWSWSAPSSWS